MIRAKAFLVIWCAWAALCVGAVAGLVYVAWHFISKHW